MIKNLSYTSSKITNYTNKYYVFLKIEFNNCVFISIHILLYKSLNVCVYIYIYNVQRFHFNYCQLSFAMVFILKKPIT